MITNIKPIDATIGRVHQHSTGAKGGHEFIGRSKGGLSAKIHVTCDALGNPTGFYLTAGQAHDWQSADVLIADIEARALLADKAYNADERMRQVLIDQGIEPVILSKSNRNIAIDYDKDFYSVRHLIEDFFAKLKQYRAIATRYDKTARNFLSAVIRAVTRAISCR